MPVIDVRERHDERRAEIKDGKLTYYRGLLVRCDDIHDGPSVAIHASGVPAYNDPFDDDPAARVSSIKCDPWENSGKHWKIDLEYSGPADTDSSGESFIPPLLRPPEFSYSASDFQEPYFLDESSPRRPVVNSAGDPFENVTERQRSELSITMVRNEDSFSPLDADYYANTTANHIVSLDGHGYAPDTLLMGMPTATKEYEVGPSGTNWSYYKVTRVWRARREGWRDALLDIGYNELSEVPGPSGTPVTDRIPILDGAGLRISRPWPLDGHGHALPEPSGTPANLEFRPYRQISWLSLGLE